MRRSSASAPTARDVASLGGKLPLEAAVEGLLGDGLHKGEAPTPVVMDGSEELWRGGTALGSGAVARLRSTSR